MAESQPRIEFDINSTALDRIKYTIQLQRQTTASTWATIANLGGRTTHYTDFLPNDGINRDYRARNTRSKWTASAYTATLSATPEQ